MKKDILFSKEGFDLVDGAGWKWKCPICDAALIISNDLEYLKKFKECHMKKHTINNNWKEEKR